MLQLVDGSIIEQASNLTGTITGDNIQNGSYTFPSMPAIDWPVNSCQTVYWNSYPVYVCTDKTAKSIQILKKLQADKVIDVKSVTRFIELVEQIAAIL